MRRVIRSLAAALVFYTCIPLPRTENLEFSTVARLAPLVGVVLGGTLGLLDLLLAWLGVPQLPRSALVVTAWVVITGGLHLDGAIDTGDGLAVGDPQRRLEVMADSRAGAFGVMSGVLVLLIKTAALGSMANHRALALMAAAGWGRWGQLLAIVAYPNLKTTGLGALHKQQRRSGWEVLPGFLLMVGVSAGGGWPGGLGLWLGGMLWAVGTGAWIYRRLGGHTGDTYGAVVEWTEALFMASVSGLGR